MSSQLPIPGCSDIYSEDFEKFWAMYPRKTGKYYAFKIFCKIVPRIPLEDILAGVEDKKKTEWRDRAPEYIPHASTFLNRGLFMDVKEKKKPSAAIRVEPSRPTEPEKRIWDQDWWQKRNLEGTLKKD